MKRQIKCKVGTKQSMEGNLPLHMRGHRSIYDVCRVSETNLFDHVNKNKKRNFKIGHQEMCSICAYITDINFKKKLLQKQLQFWLF